MARRITDLAADGALWEDASTTFAESSAGLVIGFSLGATIAMTSHQLQSVDDALRALVTSIMGIPKLALAPAITLWLGIGLISKVALVALAVALMTFTGIQAGLREVDPALVTTARVMGATELQVMWNVRVPTMLPFLFGVIKVAIPHSVTVAVASELVVSRSGLGHYIKTSAGQGDLEGTLAGVFAVVALVVSATLVLEKVERRIIAWRA